MHNLGLRKIPHSVESASLKGSIPRQETTLIHLDHGSRNEEKISRPHTPSTSDTAESPRHYALGLGPCDETIASSDQSPADLLAYDGPRVVDDNVMLQDYPPESSTGSQKAPL